MADSWDRLCQPCSAGDLEIFSTVLASGSCFYDTNLLGADDLGSYSKRSAAQFRHRSTLSSNYPGCNKKEPWVNILNHPFSYSSIKQYIAHEGSKLARTAIRSGSPEIVRLFLQTDPTLLKCSSSMELIPAASHTLGLLMAEACAVQTPEVLEAPEEAGGRYSPCIGKMQLISAAAVEGNVAMVKYYLSKGFDLNLVYSIGNTITRGPPLWSATEKRRAKTVKLLLEAGADPSAPKYQGKFAIQAAERNGFDDVWSFSIMLLVHGRTTRQTPPRSCFVRQQRITSTTVKEL